MTTKSVNRIYSDIDLNFLAHPVTGDVSKKYDVDAVKQSLKTLIKNYLTMNVLNSMRLY